MNKYFYEVILLLLIFSNCLAMMYNPLAIQASEVSANTTVHPHDLSHDSLAHNPLDLETQQVQNLLYSLNVGKITKRLISLRDLLRRDVRMKNLPDGYEIRVVPWVFLIIK